MAVEIINEFKDTKSVAVLSKANEKETIYFITKQQINASEQESVIKQIEGNPSQGLLMQNDKFRKYLIEMQYDTMTTGYNVDVISPATERDIDKNKPHYFKMVTETQEMYNTKTNQFIENMPQTEFKWIYNILDGVSEQENVLFKTHDFLAVLDMKWDRQRKEEIYGLVLVEDRKLHSVRSLDGSHIEMLERIRDDTIECLSEKYGVNKNEIITFVHYLPSFWHFHVHFCSIYSPLFKSANVNIGKAIMLDDVIQNLKLDNDYYKKVDITIKIDVKHPLYKILVE
ncbi:scavenger mRNA-decapping enzyme DcpS, putative [Entamoeba invadens IP1]|uniref:Scavenger mRNA-decapping enzyme DcpS, putative n=1 Tax=Entamoeba invadens IP1 TaxID=370355 RepID=A0A0A1UF31_ENTIV|nr:scavenger mRNA-decapping enzyme DcpS, putative [Entamoeba invadens IP1]ELP91401.1 scavenger mRNA-decapping enzyme DcpS, putative [Entamoeba invadens IP1]|eukprot:XP_004258172.1 scavenger mRNA-decapping enzyme DcpS, putative [Entamoeba invadens IP1]